MKKLLSTTLALLLCAGATVAVTSGCSSTATRESTGEYIDDATITAKVKASLISDETVKARDVQIETFRGTVQLSGFVDTMTQKTRAEQITRNTPGVRNVVNNINLKQANQP